MIQRVHRSSGAYQVTTAAARYAPGTTLEEIARVAETYDTLAQVVEVKPLLVVLVRFLPQNPLGPRQARYLILEDGNWLLANEDAIFVREPDAYESEFTPTDA